MTGPPPERRTPHPGPVSETGPILLAGGKIEMRGDYVAGRDMTVIHHARPADEALFQLPLDIADFTDRAAERDELLALIESADSVGGKVVVAAVAGKPGVGKSALVIHLAHRLAVHFPDAQLYADLRGDDRERREPADVLGDFLRALGVDRDRLPVTLHELAALYRAQLAGRRALVVLDNASGEHQVRPLLPGAPGSVALITSRAPLAALDGAQLRSLDVIDRPAAVELLAKLAGDERVGGERQAAVRIAELCGDLPLAVRIAGGLLASKRHWPLHALVARLRDERGRLSALRVGDLEVRGSFALSYNDLAVEDARLFRRLGALVGPDFGGPIAAALIDSELSKGEARLERLVDAQLLEAVGNDRYRLHDLLRLFARERLAEDPTESRAAAAIGSARRTTTSTIWPGYHIDKTRISATR